VEKEDSDLKKSLEGYKGEVPHVNKGTLIWTKDLIFLGRTQKGYEIDYDADIQWGCAPTESLLLSLAACMGIDVVSFLRKMKANLTGFKIDITGERNPKPPQYYKSFEMILNITGDHITPKNVERAISLSQEKYCSVQHSLRKDMKVSVKYTINGE